MCSITAVAIISAAMSAVSSYASIQSQNKAIKADMEAAKEASEANQVALQDAEKQAKNKEAIDKMKRQILGMKERSALRASMADAGVDGNSPLREIAVSYIAEGFDKDMIEENADNTYLQLRREQVENTRRGRATIRSLQSRVVSPLAATLKISNAGLRGYTSGSRFGKKLFPKKG